MIKRYSVCLCAAEHKPFPPSLQEKKGLYNLFKEYGEIYAINYLPGKNNQLPGVAFCKFASEESARAAINGVSDIKVDGTTIFCRNEIEFEKMKLPSKASIWIRNVSEKVTKQVLYRHVLRFGKVLSIKKVPNKNKYCVNFASTVGAYKFRKLNDVLTLDDEELYIDNDNISVDIFEEEEDAVSHVSSEISEIQEVKTEVSEIQEVKTEKSNVLKTSLIVISSLLLTASLISFIRRRKTH